MAMCTALREVLAEHAVSQASIARHLDRSADYVSGRLTGRHALSLDIIKSAGVLTGMGERALMVEVMNRVTGKGHGSSER